jgi:hypothetical protein
VRVSIRQFLGGGSHYHVSIVEEDNKVWNRAPKGKYSPGHEDEPVGWVTLWDTPPEARGRIFEGIFKRLSQAKAFVKKNLVYFPAETHEGTNDWGEPIGTYLAKYDGD